MSGHDLRLDPGFEKAPVKSQGDAGHQRLKHLRLVEKVLRTASDDVRKVAPYLGRGQIEPTAEHGIRGEEIVRHAHMLRTLAREEQGNHGCQCGAPVKPPSTTNV
jgi:D-serine dehydratase